MTTQPAIISLKNIGKTFHLGAHQIRGAHDISFDLHAGRTLALVGESGSGKTTCARIIMREYIADSGELLFNGSAITDNSPKGLKQYRKNVQMIFQDPFASLNPAHTVDYHLRRPLSLYQGHLKGQAVTDKIHDLLTQVELDPEIVAPKHPHDLSGGQRQRINIARTLAVGAKAIIADEPTSMLDVSVRQGVLELLNRMKRDLGLALLYITHDVATAHYVAEDIMVMYGGQILEWGDVKAVLSNPQHDYTRMLLAAVPDPDIRFDDPRSRLEPNAVNRVREQAKLLHPHIRSAGPNHFYRHIDG
ncbi:ABC transporter ATP-binding protein [Thalassospira marina]|uniref:Dipeptide/oligopeptide/nickel ABC transporter ATP-binding protein n=1 Tax=Thalassospira marina TaxID=2048283 RepID=A0A2N3KES2_9PROT|nr:ATP-binding cassette domain-containing protein [Thalassospira marina]AUG55359.1 dipeptide/oligopeptide/nickel ABC transporter ATP-binding protein [Thalassospira marina]PKR49024.1 dipeptide/oligopeptide/nickel ABC transporter ATP-binding protein [Thalassospira marina]